MDYDSFRRAIAADNQPDDSLPLALQAIWWDKKGNWVRAHELCQEANSSEGDWVHAYLHRVEGDVGNADYWYRRSGKSSYSGNISDEWEEIAQELLRKFDSKT